MKVTSKSLLSDPPRVGSMKKELEILSHVVGSRMKDDDEFTVRQNLLTAGAALGRLALTGQEGAARAYKIYRWLAYGSDTRALKEIHSALMMLEYGITT